MLETANADDSYKVKTMTEATVEEEEEGEFASSDSKTGGGRSIGKNYMYIAPLPSFCKVNPNLPHSKENQ